MQTQQNADQEEKLVPSNELQNEYSKILNKIQETIQSPKYISGRKVSPQKMHQEETNEHTQIGLEEQQESQIFQIDHEVEESYQQTNRLSTQNNQEADNIIDTFLQLQLNNKNYPFNNISEISLNLSVEDTDKGNQYLIGKEKYEATRIQKIWRGYKARRKFKLLVFKRKQQKFQQKQKKEIQNTTNKFESMQQSQFLDPIRENEMINKFLMYCVLMIQKNVKGYLQRRSYRLIINQIRNFQELIQTIYLGWKVRRVFKLKKIDSLKQQVLELIKMEGDLDKNQNISNEDKQFLKSIQNTLKIKKQEFCLCIQQYLKTTQLASFDNSLRTSPSKNSNEKMIKSSFTNIQNQDQNSYQYLQQKLRQKINSSQVEPCTWDEVPVGSRLKHRMVEFTEQPDETDQVNSQKHQFLKRRTQYNPKQSIQEQKLKKKPTEEMIENQPVVEVVEEKKIQKKVPKQIKQKQEKQEIIESKINQYPEDEQPQSEDNPPPEYVPEQGAKKPKRTFQKKKSQKVQIQKLNWKNVESKVNIWKEDKNQMDYIQKNFVHNSHAQALGYGKNIIQADQFIEGQGGGQGGAGQVAVQKSTPSPFKKTPQKPTRHPINNYQIVNRDHYETPNNQKVSRQKYEQHVPLEDLQKALSMNFGVKYEKIMNQIKPIQQQRNQNQSINSIIPIISKNSIYVSQFSPVNFENLVTEMEKKYEILQKLDD